jgi:hypothetical protein
MTKRSKRKQELESDMESKRALLGMYLGFGFPMSYRFRNKMKMIARGLAGGAFELNPRLRVPATSQKEGGVRMRVKADCIPMDLSLNHVKVGWRVKHFRPRRDGSYVHGTVLDTHPGQKWCLVKWDGRPGEAMVMVECLVASDRPFSQKEGE